jgi:hypothetical protein
VFCEETVYAQAEKVGLTDSVGMSEDYYFDSGL